jgi:iron complex transport system ATP-binding protein
MSLISLQDVCLFRNRVTILDRLTCQIELGQHTVILGPNGSGKTSLLKLLMRFFYPSIVPENTGTIEILGQSEWNVWELRKQLGYINSEIDFHFSHGRSGRLTGLEAVLTGFSSSELEVDAENTTEAMRGAAKEALRKRDALNLAKRTMAHLSTGERRRVLLARALVHDPQALILDEPTTGLDIAARQLLLAQMQAIANAGTTLVLVTHHVEEIVPAIQQVVLLKSGQNIFQGNRTEGLSEKRLSDLFGVLVRIENDANGMLRAEVPNPIFQGISNPRF